MNLAVSIAVGIVGGYVGMKSRIPTGTLLGSMLAVILFNSLQDKTLEIPRSYVFVSQVLIGVLIAASYTPNVLATMARLWFPVLLSCLTLIFTGITIAILLHKVFGLDFPTAYVATSPGAMNVLIMMGSDFKVDVAMVACFHFVRVLIVTSTAPLIFRFFRHFFVNF